MPDFTQNDQVWDDLSYAIEAGYLDAELDSAYTLSPDDYPDFEECSQ